MTFIILKMLPNVHMFCVYVYRVLYFASCTRNWTPIYMCEKVRARQNILYANTRKMLKFKYLFTKYIRMKPYIDFEIYSRYNNNGSNKIESSWILSILIPHFPKTILNFFFVHRFSIPYMVQFHLWHTRLQCNAYIECIVHFVSAFYYFKYK